MTGCGIPMGEIAWLGMYDHPGQHAANDRFWAGIRDALRAAGVRRVPERLIRDVPTAAVWSHPHLLFGMICTRPWTLEHPNLRLLGHPVYAGTDLPGEHRSLIVVRADDAARDLAELRGRRVAINDRGSNTGMALLRDRVAPLAGEGRFFGEVVVTGAHRVSAWAVTTGEADVASIDEVTFAALARFEPEATRRLRVLDRSAPAATPAFVTAADTPIDVVARLRVALERAVADAPDELGITGLVASAPGLRERIVAQDRAATAAGYPVLA